MDIAQETRTESFETITVECYGVPGHAPPDEVVAVAWERAQAAVRGAFTEYGWDVRAEERR